MRKGGPKNRLHESRKTGQAQRPWGEYIRISSFVIIKGSKGRFHPFGGGRWGVGDFSLIKPPRRVPGTEGGRLFFLEGAEKTRRNGAVGGDYKASRLGGRKKGGVAKSKGKQQDRGNLGGT